MASPQPHSPPLMNPCRITLSVRLSMPALSLLPCCSLPCSTLCRAGFTERPPAYVWGFWSLVLCLFFSTPAHAAWEAVEKHHLLRGLQTVYIDPDIIQREGNLVTIWQLIDFKWMQGNPRGTPRFLSTKTHKQFDCANKRFRLLAFTEFSRPMGTGISSDGYVDTGNWVSIEPDTMNQSLWEVVCGRE
jgi:hypothetical protein